MPKELWTRQTKKKICNVCGYNKHVEVAHLKPIHSFPKETLLETVNNISNLLYLCPNCHWEHDNGLLDATTSQWNNDTWCSKAFIFFRKKTLSCFICSPSLCIRIKRVLRIWFPICWSFRHVTMTVPTNYELAHINLKSFNLEPTIGFEPIYPTYEVGVLAIERSRQTKQLTNSSRTLLLANSTVHCFYSSFEESARTSMGWFHCFFTNNLSKSAGVATPNIE